MYEEIIFHGLGGQGALTAGQLLCTAAMRDGLHVACIPSYAPEVRGGESNCFVMLSSSPVGSVVMAEPTGLVLLSDLSARKFVPMVLPGGIIVYNSTLVPESAVVSDLPAIPVPASELADDLGSLKVTNMILVAAYVAARQPISIQTLKDTMAGVMKGKRAGLLALNNLALDAGIAVAERFLARV